MCACYMIDYAKKHSNKLPYVYPWSSVLSILYVQCILILLCRWDAVSFIRCDMLYSLSMCDDSPAGAWHVFSQMLFDVVLTYLPSDCTVSHMWEY